MHTLVRLSSSLAPGRRASLFPRMGRRITSGRASRRRRRRTTTSRMCAKEKNNQQAYAEEEEDQLEYAED